MIIEFENIRRVLKLKLLLLPALLFFSLKQASAQQDPQYSQYMFNQLVINPAFAGSKDAISTTLVVRTQWVGIAGAPNTQTFSIHTPLSKKKIGIGFHVVADQIGPVKSTGAFGSYAYKIQLPKGKLALGLRLGVYQYVYDWGAITHYDPIDNVYLHNNSTYYVPSADFGLYYSNSDMYIGLSVTQLFNGRISSITEPNGDYSSFVPHEFLTFGKAFDVSSSILLNPSFVIKTALNSPYSADLNMNVLIDRRVWAGLSYRTDFGLVLLTAVNITAECRVGYSFDWGFSQLTTFTGGSHEVSLAYNFGTLHRSNVFSPRYF